MKISRYDPRSRYRNRSQQRMSSVAGLAFVCLIGVGVGAGLGYRSAQVDQTGIKMQLETVSAERDQLRQSVTRLMADSHSANIKYQQIEEQFQNELPQDGPLKDIVTQIRDQLVAGVAPERLANLIRSSSPPRNCNDPEVKRFIVQTPKNKGADNAAVIANGNITVRAVGEPARGKTGKEEAWYDPARPVTLNFEWNNGEKELKTQQRKNNLPISQVLVVDKREYRMTFSEGAKSFIKVTFDSCDYP
jgi:hypothetical protein